MNMSASHFLYLVLAIALGAFVAIFIAYLIVKNQVQSIIGQNSAVSNVATILQNL